MRKKYGSSHPVSKQIINSVSELSCLFLTEGGKHTIYYVIRFIDNDVITYMISRISHKRYIKKYHILIEPMLPLSNQDITSFQTFFYFTTYIGKEIY